MDKTKISPTFIQRHLLKCGTCKFKKKGFCNNFMSKDYGNIVDDLCSCDLYIPAKVAERYI